jgi:hypothetical protein
MKLYSRAKTAWILGVANGLLIQGRNQASLKTENDALKQ